MFAMLDDLERHLGRDKFVVGEHLTEADIRLFVTLVRFDVAYYGLFKCNRKRIADYPALTAYLSRMLSVPEIRATVNIGHIKQGYYSIRALNPSGIVPLGPELSDALCPHIARGVRYPSIQLHLVAHSEPCS